MKSFFLAIPVLLSSYLLFSQPDSKVKYHTSNVKVPYPALIKHLTKENTYKFIFPEKLTYYFSRQQMQLDGMTFPYSELYLKAKNKDNPEIYFVVDAKGISNVESTGIRQTPNGFVIDYSYRFPCKLLIQDPAKSNLYSIDIFSDNQSFTIVYFRNMADYGKLGYAPQYFATWDEAAGYRSATKDLAKHIERNALPMAYKEVAKAISALYNDYSERHQLQWGDIADAKAVPEYVALNNAAASLGQAYDLLSDVKMEEANKLMQTARQEFEKYKDVNNAVSGPQVKTMILYNLGWIYLLSGETKAALDLYEKCIPSADRYTKYGWDELKQMAGYSQYREKLKMAIAK